jgi:superfamily II DNA or RNA helicase
MTPVKFTPREYQRIARDFILDHQRCNLFAVPGMGKTSTVYSVIDILKLCGSSFFPVLVIAPKKVVELPWPSEQKKWLDFNGLRVVSILGEATTRDEALMAKGDVFPSTTTTCSGSRKSTPGARGRSSAWSPTSQRA